ncbi:PCI domain-containing protein [Niveomyces insectorum RCEF 264]|uniref:COP9 signalosome complex subunit 4 n=1 Tax=Niveomyces insectorum RCEF 264 TaxID=1081102 RepID=A0A167WYN1_9HYPO|nr:PCI domain-containing protein [Niveomyces insectorum RCEF 264]
MVASPKVTNRLAQVETAADRGAALLDILNNFKTLSSPDTIADDLIALCDCLFDSALGIVSARSLLDGTINTLKSYENDAVWLRVGKHLLGRLEGAAQARFLEQLAAVCDLVATACENQEEFSEAAALLASVPLDSSQRRVSQEDKVRMWVRIVRDYLEVDDTTAAESYLNKLKGVIFDVHDQELNLHFKLSQARINDAKREFLAASTAYHDISYSPAIAEEERLHTLSMAIKCALLAPAGPTRSRVLGRLYKDDRAETLDEFAILEKMFLNRLLTPAEVDKFAQSLQPHQLATTADGSTVLAKAVVEHNLLAVSLLYRNIQLDNLAFLLGLDAHKAEETTARMVEQGRLLGRIDQIEGLVWFEGGEASGAKGSGRAEGAVDKELRQWDANVQGLAEEVETITNSLQLEFPDFVAQNLVV